MDYGLIGGKLGHSYSKDIHEMLADYTYDLCPLTKEEFVPFMEQHAFRAINVTIPYKQDVIPYLDSLDDNAKAIGAVNTIVNKDGRLEGHNTDFSGFMYMLKKHNISVKGKKCVVLGDGGASKAVVAVLKKMEAKKLLLLTLSRQHLRSLMKNALRNIQMLNLLQIQVRLVCIQTVMPVRLI